MEDFRPSARVIADSISPGGVRLTTMEVNIHLFIHRQFNTHRALSRNSASNRAIPVHKTLARVAERPALPLVWPQEKPGMQGGPPLPSAKADQAREIWLAARDKAVQSAEQLLALGVHKSIVNRLLEPFQYVTIVCTATDWDDFFIQRLAAHTGEPLAQAEIRVAAERMFRALSESRPERVELGQWHLPYLKPWELQSLPNDQAISVSAARCARVSYLTHDGKRDIQADLDLYNRLVSANPPHWSPLEHVATPAMNDEAVKGNYTGWLQLRHMLAERAAIR